MPLELPSQLPPLGTQTEPDKVRVAAVVGGMLGAAPARGFGLTPDELTIVEALAAGDSPAALPIFTNIKITTFTSSGTFTPDANMVCCEVWGWGGGGGGGGAAATGVSQFSTGTGGNAGALAYAKLTLAQIGASKTVTIGAGGTGVSGAAGNAGSVTTLGSLVSAAGGQGGTQTGPAAGAAAIPAAATQSVTGDVRGWTYLATMSASTSGAGFSLHSLSGQNELGGAIMNVPSANGTAANANTGAGGGSCRNIASEAARTGGTGGSGLLIVREYLKA